MYQLQCHLVCHSRRNTYTRTVPASSWQHRLVRGIGKIFVHALDVKLVRRRHEKVHMFTPQNFFTKWLNIWCNKVICLNNILFVDFPLKSTHEICFLVSHAWNLAFTIFIFVTGSSGSYMVSLSLSLAHTRARSKINRLLLLNHANFYSHLKTFC